MAEGDTNEAGGNNDITPTEDKGSESSKSLVEREETLPARKEQEEAQKALEAVSKGDKRANAFNAIALMLKNMRTDLEGIHRTPQPPRWVRVARVREFNEPGAINLIARDGVIPITKGFIKIIGFFAELTMKAQEILTQADGGKALLEVGAGMIKTASSNEFYESIAESVGLAAKANPLQAVGGIVDTAVKIVDKIPDPEDVKVVAKQLFLLLCVDQEQLPLGPDGKVDTGKLPPETTRHINDTTGKIRLLSWALDIPISFHALNPEDGVAVSKLGSRRVWEATDGVPSKASLTWGDDQIVVYEFYYSNENAGKDIQEAIELLEELGYIAPDVGDKTVFNAAVAQRLRQFQKINGLDITGRLDNHTINQLMNLDYENGTLRRARPFSDAAVEGFDDTKNPEPDKVRKPAPKRRQKKRVTIKNT